jgi:hypothetical protein
MKLNNRYIAATADIIGAASHPALLGEAGNVHRAYWRSRANS